jgi:beta-lactamase regulating signal transducer with metallopeptidase domain
MSAAELSQITGVQTVAWALLHSLWQGALVALALAGALVVLRRSGAAARHAAALVALIALPVLPVLMAWQGGDRAAASVRGGSPEWGARPGRAEGAQQVPASPQQVPASPLEPQQVPKQVPKQVPASSWPQGVTAASALPRRASGSGLQPRGDAAARPAAVAEPAAAPQALLSSWIARVRVALRPYLPVLVAAWLAGVLALSLIHLGGLRRVRQVRRSARPAGDIWQSALERLCRRMGIARPVELLESASLAVPAVAGWLRPVLLLPASTLTGLSPQQVEALIAHELAHVQRGDLAVNLLQAGIETLLFYHPAAWWISRVVREERESCCDDLAVAACGDRLVYARALADLEGLRAAALPSGAFGALGADGGSLLARIRRLVAPQAPPRRGNVWLAGLLGLVVCAVAAVALPLFAPVEIRLADRGFGFGSGSAGASDQAEGSEKRSGHATDHEGDEGVPAGVRSGSWTLERQDDGDLQLSMKMRWKGGSSQSSFPVESTQLTGLGTGSDVRFSLRRDAGSFRFQGRFDGKDGGGTFTFESDPGYVREMAALGWTVPEGRQLELALHDVPLAFARELRELGYGGEPLDRLVELSIHDVSAEYIRALAEAGQRQIPAERLVELRIHDVQPELVRELAAAGYDALTPERLVELRIHDVTPEYVRALGAAGQKNLPLDRLVELRIHDVTPDYARGLAEAGYDDLPAERLVELRIHDVTSEYVQGLAAAGLTGIPVERLVEMRIHDVQPELVRDMAAAGYRDLTPEQLVELRIHDVGPDFVREAAERGHRNVPLDELIELRIQGFGRHGR